MPPTPLIHGHEDISRSPHHYYPGCDLIIRVSPLRSKPAIEHTNRSAQAENTLYGVDETRFRFRSGKLGDILNTHRSEDAQIGSSDKQPLVIEVAAESMDSFMEALWHAG